MAQDNEHTRHSGKKHLGPARTSPYAVSRLAPPHELVESAKEIASADSTLSTVVNAKLSVIVEQIRNLQAQGQRIIEEAQEHAQLHRAHCSFKKKPGNTYYLYETAEHTLYFSLLSPADWKHNPPHPFAGSYTLQADMSWTAHEDNTIESPST